MNQIKKWIPICACLLFLILFGYSTIVQPNIEKNETDKSALYTVAPFKLGVAIEPTLLKNNPKYRQVVLREFNSVTSENCMKMNRIVNIQGKYNWEAADEFVEFAQQNNKRIHGHTLVWHRALPAWVENFTGDNTVWDMLLKDYITTVVTHFKGKVTSWDVVNEAFENDGTYRQSIWYKKLGKEYIEKSFRYAHAADPNAMLFYNDYGQENSDEKREAIKEMLSELKKKGIPINGVGFQLHTNVNLKKEKLIAALTTMAEPGLLVHISELTILVNPHRTNQSFVQDSQSIEKQMEKFAEIITEYKHIIPKKQQYGITFWNVGDGDSYYPKQCNCKEYPQMFDSAYEKKAYFGKVIDALKR